MLALGKIRGGSIKFFFALRAAKHTVAIQEPHGEQITTLVSRILGLAMLRYRERGLELRSGRVLKGYTWKLRKICLPAFAAAGGLSSVFGEARGGSVTDLALQKARGGSMR